MTFRDTDSDGIFDEDDLNAISGATTYDVRKDVNLDGEVDVNDFFDALAINDGYRTLGRGVLHSDLYANRRGYAGYEYDPTFQGADRNLYHVRNRVYDADSGRWNRRDPLGYVDGMGLYEYVKSMPILHTDPMGLWADWTECVSYVFNILVRDGGGHNWKTGMRLRNDLIDCCQSYPKDNPGFDDCVQAAEERYRKNSDTWDDYPDDWPVWHPRMRTGHPDGRYRHPNSDKLMPECFIDNCIDEGLRISCENCCLGHCVPNNSPEYHQCVDLCQDLPEKRWWEYISPVRRASISIAGH